MKSHFVTCLSFEETKLHIKFLKVLQRLVDTNSQVQKARDQKY